MQLPPSRRMPISVDPLTTTKCPLLHWVESMRNRTKAAHGPFSTSPEPYRTHCCHVKSTNSKRLSDTVQFQHKHITNPSPSPQDKLMAAIADLTHTIHGMGSHPAKTALHELSALLRSTPHTGSLAPRTPLPALPRVQSLPRVGEHPDATPDPLMRITRSMAPMPVPGPHTTPSTPL